MYRLVVLFVGCLGVAWFVGGFDCAVAFVVLGDAGLCCFLRVTRRREETREERCANVTG